jgi:hypothetical protein
MLRYPAKGRRLAQTIATASRPTSLTSTVGPRFPQPSQLIQRLNPLYTSSSRDYSTLICSHCNSRRLSYRLARRIPHIMTLSKRVVSSKSDRPLEERLDGAKVAHDHDHAHDHAHDHGHDHSHGLFSTHKHDHSEGAEQLVKAWSAGKLDRGTKITLLGRWDVLRILPFSPILIAGLGSNVALTVAKGLAGLLMNSASLLAEAGHSLSDLLGVSGRWMTQRVRPDAQDFVTLATWRISRRLPTDAFPWGYSKFETFGTLSVSVILVGGAIGIGLHSYHVSNDWYFLSE